jgi:oligopeptide/dipeptide ABC transporter ATP-binding protein
MTTVGIRPEYINRFPHQFSGGQRQRIGIARAIALNPKFIVCDEPVSALDVSIQSQILNLLRDLQQQKGLTYLFISHDLGVVRYISTRVCVMFLGKICEIGKTEEIYNDPLHPYTKFLIDAVPEADPTTRDEDKHLLTGEIPSPVNPPSGCRFHTRCPFAKKICEEKEPELTDSNGRLVACHFPGIYKK